LSSAIVVAAAVVERNGRILVTRRQPGVHLAGLWEFPGGKCEAGETLAACLARELHEELAVVPVDVRELFSTTHGYAEKTVEMHFFACDVVGEPVPQIGQDMRWVNRADLSDLDFPAADAQLIALLRRTATP
jgi:8-oxo-dGTP diphosphatase